MLARLWREAARLHVGAFGAITSALTESLPDKSEKKGDNNVDMIIGGQAVIVVTPSRSLERQTGASLLHLPDGRAIISFDRSMTIAQLELTIADALEARTLAPADRQVFQGVADILRAARRSSDTTLSQRQIIVVESRGRRRSRRSA